MSMTQTAPSQAAAVASRLPGLRNRPIELDDHAGLSLLLAEGFPARSPDQWLAALSRLQAISQSSHGRGIGFVLASDDAPVGVLLTVRSPDGLRCSMSSWYVQAEFRRYATLLVSMAVRDRSVTYLNISSEQHTRPIIEAQGFKRYVDGIFLGLPLLGRGAPRGLTIVQGDAPQGFVTQAEEHALAQGHAALGCIVLWRCEAGRASPFIFARRRIANRVPAAQVIYCPADADWRRVVRPIGLALLGHGLFCMLIDATGPVAGMPGRYMPGRMPKFVRGSDIPRLGDLAWTEAAVFGA